MVDSGTRNVTSFATESSVHVALARTPDLSESTHSKDQSETSESVPSVKVSSHFSSFVQVPLYSYIAAPLQFHIPSARHRRRQVRRRRAATGVQNVDRYRACRRRGV